MSSRLYYIDVCYCSFQIHNAVSSKKKKQRYTCMCTYAHSLQIDGRQGSSTERPTTTRLARTTVSECWYDKMRVPVVQFKQ
jgi:hypothetical protein